MAIITQVLPTKKQKGNMLEVFIDDESYGLIHVEAFVKSGLKVGREIDGITLKQTIDSSNVLVAIDMVNKLLSKMLKTEKEIITYLKQKGFNEYVINATIDKFKEYKIINDLSYADRYITSKKSTYGKKRIKMELINKGIDDKTLDTAFNDFENDFNTVMRLALKYMKNKVVDMKNLAKLSNYLLSRGFDYEEINRAVRKFKEGEIDEDWM